MSVGLSIHPCFCIGGDLPSPPTAASSTWVLYRSPRSVLRWQTAPCTHWWWGGLNTAPHWGQVLPPPPITPSLQHLPLWTNLHGRLKQEHLSWCLPAHHIWWKDFSKGRKVIRVGKALVSFSPPVKVTTSRIDSQKAWFSADEGLKCF